MRGFLLMACLLAAPVFAGDLAEGELIYGFHCAGCHGPDAKGDGPTASLLTVRPADLTRLAANAGGEFPIFYVADRIDGTVNMAAHGGPMPIFGLILEGAPEVLSAAAGEAIVPGAIADVIAFLETLQVR